jgi:cell wall assembly regulator SMI1
MSNSDHTKYWDRIDAVLESQAPLVFQQLKPPASVKQISETESALGVVLPEEIRVAYLRHNGCLPAWRLLPGPPQQNRLFVPYFNWCDLDVMVQRWQLMQSELKLSQQLRPDWYVGAEDWWNDLDVKPEGWRTQWIPIGLSDTPDTLYIDLDPGPKGSVGQMISTDGAHDGASVFAANLNDYLARLIDGLEAGSITHEGVRGFVDKATDQRIMSFWPELHLW